MKKSPHFFLSCHGEVMLLLPRQDLFFQIIVYLLNIIIYIIEYCPERSLSFSSSLMSRKENLMGEIVAVRATTVKMKHFKKVIQKISSYNVAERKTEDPAISRSLNKLEI